MTVYLTLPVPPSTNQLFRNVPGRGRVKTARYRQWIEAAGWSAKSQKPGRVAGPYTVRIRLPEALAIDIDNAVKPVVDLLVRLGITDDDKSLTRLEAERFKNSSGDILTITVEAA